MIPKMLYEVLLHSYLLIGVFGLTGVGNIIGKLRGVILIVVGIVIHQIRARYRTEERLSRQAAASGRDPISRTPHSGKAMATAGLDSVFRYSKRNITLQQGFTLLELMIVVAIIAILAAIAIPAYKDYIVRSKISECVAALDACKTAVIEYWDSTNQIPANALSAGCSQTPSQYCKGISVNAGQITVTVDSFKVGIPGSDCTLTLTPGMNTWDGSTTCLSKYVPATFRG